MVTLFLRVRYHLTFSKKIYILLTRDATQNIERVKSKNNENSRAIWGHAIWITANVN